MCGIAGIYRPRGVVLREELETMAHALGHRGPDAWAVWNEGPIGLAHTRLRIVDLSERGAQPMRRRDSEARIVFNGEMYNHRPVRATLEARGVRFESTSDTEVLLATYLEHERNMLGMIEGMFAFAIWDPSRQRLLLARDRAGEKPLFYLPLPDGGLAFASEIKALLAVPALGVTRDVSRIPDYLLSGYASPPRTFYKGVLHLPPAHVLAVTRGDVGTPRAYWTPRFQASDRAPSYEDAKRELRSRLRDIVRDRLDADVPVGAFLSGGLDSATVVGVATKDLGKTVHTYSIGFEDRSMDESADAKISAQHLGSVHEEFIVGERDIPSVEMLVHHHDAPFADSSAIPTYLVSKMARSRVTVAVTGDGGDEIFGGYPRFVGGMLGELVPSWLGRASREASRTLRASGKWHGSTTSASPLARAERFAAAVERPLARRMLHWTSVFPFESLSTLTKPELSAEAASAADFSDAVFAETRGQSPLARILHHNFRAYLPEDLMVKVDRCSMAVSLETRSPLLDSGLIDFVGALPDSYKIRGFRTKHILRDTFSDLLAPVLLKRPKRGFGVPLAKWLDGPLRTQMEDHIRTESAEIYRYVDRAEVQRSLWSSPKLDASRALQAWTLLTLEIWLRGSKPASS